MSDQWYYFANGRKLGPVSLGTLKKLIDEGVVRSDSEVFREGMPDWVSARQVPELFGGAAMSSDVYAPESYKRSDEPEPAEYGRRSMQSEPAPSSKKPNYLPWVIGGGIALFLLVGTTIGVLVYQANERENERRHRESIRAEVILQEENYKKELAKIKKERNDTERQINDEAWESEHIGNRDSAKKAIKCLKKLRSITEAGLSFNDYQAKLLDSKVEFDDAITKVAYRSELDVALRESMEIYLEARDYWGQCIRYDEGRAGIRYQWKNPDLGKKYVLAPLVSNQGFSSDLQNMWSEAFQRTLKASELSQRQRPPTWTIDARK